MKLKKLSKSLVYRMVQDYEFCEHPVNFRNVMEGTRKDSFTLRNFDERPFKYIEWCKQFL